jgi:hypothetical protein
MPTSGLETQLQILSRRRSSKNTKRKTQHGLLSPAGPHAAKTPRGATKPSVGTLTQGLLIWVGDTTGIRELEQVKPWAERDAQRP